MALRAHFIYVSAVGCRQLVHLPCLVPLHRQPERISAKRIGKIRETTDGKRNLNIPSWPDRSPNSTRSRFRMRSFIGVVLRPLGEWRDSRSTVAAFDSIVCRNQSRESRVPPVKSPRSFVNRGDGWTADAGLAIMQSRQRQHDFTFHAHGTSALSQQDNKSNG